MQSFICGLAGVVVGQEFISFCCGFYSYILQDEDNMDVVEKHLSQLRKKLDKFPVLEEVEVSEQLSMRTPQRVLSKQQ